MCFSIFKHGRIQRGAVGLVPLESQKWLYVSLEILVRTHCWEAILEGGSYGPLWNTFMTTNKKLSGRPDGRFWIRVCFNTRKSCLNVYSWLLTIHLIKRYILSLCTDLIFTDHLFIRKLECYNCQKKSILFFNKFHLILIYLFFTQNEEIYYKICHLDSNN